MRFIKPYPKGQETKKDSGFIPILIVVVISLMVGGGGAYYVTSHSKEKKTDELTSRVKFEQSASSSLLGIQATSTTKEFNNESVANVDADLSINKANVSPTITTKKEGNIVPIDPKKKGSVTTEGISGACGSNPKADDELCTRIVGPNWVGYCEPPKNLLTCVTPEQLTQLKSKSTQPAQPAQKDENFIPILITFYEKEIDNWEDLLDWIVDGKEFIYDRISMMENFKAREQIAANSSNSAEIQEIHNLFIKYYDVDINFEKEVIDLIDNGFVRPIEGYISGFKSYKNQLNSNTTYVSLEDIKKIVEKHRQVWDPEWKKAMEAYPALITQWDEYAKKTDKKLISLYDQVINNYQSQIPIQQSSSYVPPTRSTPTISPPKRQTCSFQSYGFNNQMGRIECYSF